MKKSLFAVLLLSNIAFAALPLAPSPGAGLMSQQHKTQNSEGAIQGPIKALYFVEDCQENIFEVVLYFDPNEGRCGRHRQLTPLVGFECPNKQKTLIIFDGYGYPRSIICK